MKAYKDKEATAAAKNMQEGMGEKKTLAGCSGKGYFGSSYFWLANELRRVAAHMASFYNLSINSKMSATSLIKCTSVRKISIRIRSFWEIVYGNNLEFYDQWRILVCPHASIFFEKSQGVRGICRGLTRPPERDQEVSLQADKCRTVMERLLQKIHVYWFIN